jgi:hypothetical protein
VEEVAVDRQREGRGGVPEATAHAHHVEPGRDQGRGVAVPQGVERHLGQLPDSNTSAGYTSIRSGILSSAAGGTGKFTLSSEMRTICHCYRIHGAHGASHGAVNLSSTPPSISPSWGGGEPTLFITSTTARSSGGSITGAPDDYEELQVTVDPESGSFRLRVGSAHRIVAATESPGAFDTSGLSNIRSMTAAIRLAT